MKKRFEGKTIFITGGARGQGRGVAIEFAKEGANIIVFDLGDPIEYPAYNRTSSKDLETLEREINDLEVGFLGVTGDVRNLKELEKGAEKGYEAFGRIDILFNNAGICAYGEALDITEKEWDSMIDINLKGSFLAGKAVIPYILKGNKGGVVINNSSIAGLRGMKRLSHYAASKE